MPKERICVTCGRAVSYQNIVDGRAYTFNGVVKHTDLDCKDNIEYEDLRCLVHHNVSLKFLYEKANGERVYSCSNCEKWWRLKQIRKRYQ